MRHATTAGVTRSVGRDGLDLAKAALNGINGSRASLYCQATTAGGAPLVGVGRRCCCRDCDGALHVVQPALDPVPASHLRNPPSSGLAPSFSGEAVENQKMQLLSDPKKAQAFVKLVLDLLREAS